jgi:hypothetical protein
MVIVEMSGPPWGGNGGAGGEEVTAKVCFYAQITLKSRPGANREAWALRRDL